jgi:hypothetical protein
LINEFIPGSATMIDEIIVGFKDAVGEPVIAEKLPDVFDWVEFGAFRRQGDDGDVGNANAAPTDSCVGLARV